ncbi:MAG: uracil-DNA glycosylase [Massilia sp.]|nr:uracil-DNA glycosylase [Massilia sp.]
MSASTIDPRNAAFLAEMGITPLWQMRAASQPLADAVPADFDPVLPADPALPAETPVEADIGAMDWRTLNNAIAACERCGCKNNKEGAGAKKAIAGDGARSAVWMVVAGATTVQDEAERQPLAGAPGKLLANMLKAVQLSREENVYVTNLVKCRLTSAGGGERAPTADEVQACRPFVERELALCGAGVVLTLGQVATNALLEQPLSAPLAESRGKVQQFGGAALVATLHPAELLQRGPDKALAWADLCLARATHGQPQ